VKEMQRPYDTTSWPCQTPDIYWALSDDLRNIGRRTFVDEDFAEYEIDINDLPDGRRALWKINALRNINVLGLDDKAVKASLVLGSSTLQTIDLDETTQFSMFTKDQLLPLFILDEPLVVRVEFRGLRDIHTVPRKLVDADGLLVRITDKKMPFFVSASKDSILTYDGFKTNVKSRVSSDLMPLESSEDEEWQDNSNYPKFRADVHEEDGEILESRWQCVNNDACTTEDLWRALKV
jgi:hypothetical protein